MFKFIGNILWFIFTGLETAVMYFGLALLWLITIIGAPLGIQLFKMGRLTLWPFGRVVVKERGRPILNVIWFILGGFVIFSFYLIIGVIWCITIIGIPFGRQCFKLAVLSATPFGRVVQKA